MDPVTTRPALPTIDDLPPIALQAAALVLAALLAIGTLWWLWRWYARHRSRARLHSIVVAAAFEHLRDVLVPDGQGGWLFVDYLLLTARGVVVLDLRRVAGNIFGGDQMTEWTIMHRNQRLTFANPQTALYDRLAAVRALAQELPVDGRIVFTASARFPKGLPKYTLMVDSLPAEYPVTDRHSMANLLQRWEADWRRIAAAVTTGAPPRLQPVV